MGERSSEGRNRPSLPRAVLDAIVEHSSEGLLVVERVRADDGGLVRRIAVINEVAARLLGSDVAALTGTDPLGLLAPETDAAALERIDAALARDEVCSWPLTLQHGGGGLVRVNTRCFLGAGTDGMLEVVLLRDAQWAAPDDLPSHDEAWALAVVSGITDVVLLADEDGLITWISPSVRTRLGYDPAELLGRTAFDFVDPDQLEAAAIEWVETVATGSRFSPAAYRIRHADGTWRVMNISAAPLYDDPTVRGMLLTLSDLTEHAEAEARVAASERWAKALIEGGSGLVTISDADGVVTYCSSASSVMLGRDPAELLGRRHTDLLHPDDLDEVAEAFEAALQDRLDGPVEFRLRHADGSWRVLSAAFANMLDSPTIGGLVVTAQDITRRRRAEHVLAEQTDLLEAIARGAPVEITLQKVAQMVEHTIEGSQAAVGMLDADGMIHTRAAPTLSRRIVNVLDNLPTDAPLAEAIRAADEPLDLDLHDPSAVLAPVAALPGAPAGEDPFAAAGLARCRMSTLRAPGSGEVLGTLSVFLSDHRPLGAFEEEVLGRAANVASIAIERRRFESRLEYQALYDPLTGLPNRSLLLARIAEGLQRTARVHGGVAVLFIDLDRFKVINDSVGHALGDELLCLVADRLRGPLRPGDTLGRFGGDEFMVVCNRVGDEEDALALGQQFAVVLSEPFELGERGGAGTGTVHVTVSMGIAFSADPLEQPEALIRNADVAMYRAKDYGRNQLHVFSQRMDGEKVEQLALEQALRAAIAGQEFELHFQPVVDLRDGRMAHAEALVRWQRPGHGLVMPGLFIPLAEETGLIVPLGWWVLDEACRLAAAWPELPGGQQVQIAVNLSARQLAAADLIPTVQRVLEATGLAPGRLCFEITESDLVRDVESAVVAVNRLKELGVLIAIDDFGTGYSSLDYIRQFTMADYLKIDRSFVDGVEREGSEEAAIVTAAIGMAKSLGLTVVAEGVETLFQMEKLQQLDCDLAQGFLFSRPVPVAAAIELMAGQR